jgi:hypothetical protein
VIGLCGPRRRCDVTCMLCVLVLIMIVWILMIPCSPLGVGVLSIYVSILPLLAASALAYPLLRAAFRPNGRHLGVKLSFVNVTIFLSGLRAQKRRCALLAEFACRTGKPDKLTTARDEQHPTITDALQSLTATS